MYVAIVRAIASGGYRIGLSTDPSRKPLRYVPYSAAMRLKTDWDGMLSQRNYSTIELVSRIENRAEILNMMADAPKKNVLNIEAWAPDPLLETNKEMLLPLERITDSAMVSKLVTCMSNQESRDGR